MAKTKVLKGTTDKVKVHKIKGTNLVKILVLNSRMTMNVHENAIARYVEEIELSEKKEVAPEPQEKEINEQSLSSMNRKQLDEVAKGMGIDTSDMPSKGDVQCAILEKKEQGAE